MSENHTKITGTSPKSHCQGDAAPSKGVWTPKIYRATRPFLCLSDMQHGVFLNLTVRHEVSLKSTGRHEVSLNSRG